METDIEMEMEIKLGALHSHACMLLLLTCAYIISRCTASRLLLFCGAWSVSSTLDCNQIHIYVCQKLDDKRIKLPAPWFY